MLCEDRRNVVFDEFDWFHYARQSSNEPINVGNEVALRCYDGGRYNCSEPGKRQGQNAKWIEGLGGLLCGNAGTTKLFQGEDRVECVLV